MAKALQPDDRIAHYRVIRSLGAGGMGEVYLARDSTLDRDVALKVLPLLAQEVDDGDDRLRRFVQEAKSASALSHPHIITIYEIGCEPVARASGQAAGRLHYIAMEFVDGTSLADLIHVPWCGADTKTLIGVLAQAAEGIAKAHGAGIVHRDLKPGNIMVSRDGYAKVLDFGLAKLVEKPASDHTVSVATRQSVTMQGLIVGTIGYMAPEQILGRPVDHRADIFSFGCILYEAITRKRPFVADSQFESLQKIVHEQPPPIESVVADVPAELGTLVTGCLAKLPDDRLQSMDDIAQTLWSISSAYEMLSSGSHRVIDSALPPLPSATAILDRSAAAVPAAPAPKSPRLALLTGAAILVIAVAAVVVWKFTQSDGGRLSDAALSQMRISSVLSNDLLQGTAVSPDGRYAAFVSLSNTLYQLRVRQISTTTVIDIVTLQPEPITDLTFSPDGDHLWYVVREPNGLYSSIYEVPSLGGTPRKVISDADAAPAFSPDGRTIAFIRGVPDKKETLLILHSLEGGADRTIATVASEIDVVIDKPRWSPDGARIAVVSKQNPLHPSIDVFDVRTGHVEHVGKWDGSAIDSAAWMGTDGLVFAAATSVGSPIQLWHMSYPGGERRRLTNDTSSYDYVSISIDGKTIATRRTQRLSEIWQVPADGSAEMSQVTSGKENLSSVAGLADGTILFVSPQNDTLTLWAAKPGGSRAALSPKGTSVPLHRLIAPQNATAFTAVGADLVGHVYRTDVDGANTKQLTSGEGEALVSVTPDGRYIFYNSPRELRQLLMVSSDGSGSPRRVADDFVDGLIFSRDSRLMSYNHFTAAGGKIAPVRAVLSLQDGKPAASIARLASPQFTTDGSSFTYPAPAPQSTMTMMKIPVGGGTPEKLFDMPESRIDVHRWIDDRTMIMAVRSAARPTTNLWRWTEGMAKPAAITSFPSGVIFELSPAPDGRMIYFTQGSLNRDIIKITGLK